MAIQLGALRDALISAGAPEDKASRASEELAAYDNRLATMDVHLEKIAGNLVLIQWMLATTLGLVVLILGNLFALWVRMGDLGGKMDYLTTQIAQLLRK